LTPTIRVTDAGDGDWGLSHPHVEAVASSVTSCFPVFGDESLTISLLCMPDHAPMTIHDATLPPGEEVVWVSVQGPYFSQLAYQFAHELCHVIADPRTFRWDRFLWFEEALCETASLFALRTMAETWSVTPPFLYWQDYAPHLADYASDHLSDPARRLPAGAPFATWLAAQLPVLEQTSPGWRDVTTVIAKELLMIFERDPLAWRSVRDLHAWSPPPGAAYREYFEGWAMACPVDCRRAVESISDMLGVAAIGSEIA
jgi:hypothetical protein